jgi:hypothetical protein
MPYDLCTTNVMRLVGTRFLQHLPARITCGWSGEPVKCCRCIHCFPECIYCQALNDACHCVKDWRHPVTNPSAEEEELEYEQTWRKRKDVALLEWNLIPGYQVQEVRVPGCGRDEQGIPVYTPIYKPSYRTPHWRKVYIPGSVPILELGVRWAEGRHLDSWYSSRSQGGAADPSHPLLQLLSMCRGGRDAEGRN